MRELVSSYLNKGISRRDFARRLGVLGFTTTAISSILEPLEILAMDEGQVVPNAKDEVVISGTGGELLVAQARAAGVEYLFTNPGSYEVGFFDAIVDDEQIHLIEGLHEGIVISMADGYHKVSGKPAFVNVHAIAGTAQMAGQLYNASRDGSAIVVTAGLNDNESWSDEVRLGPRPGFDQKEVNRQFTKISWEARQSASLPLMLRRAFKVATTEPGGPVYLATASDALEQKNISASVYPAERFLTRTPVHADSSAVQKAAEMLIRARRPVVIAGDGVWKAGAQQELVEFAEQLGLPIAFPNISAERDPIFANFPSQHPLLIGYFDDSSEFINRGVDLILFAGAADAGGKVIPRSPEIPASARIVRLGLDTDAFGRNYATDVALVCDVKAGLTDLRACVDSIATKDRLAKIAGERSGEVHTFTHTARARLEKEIAASLGQSPMHPHELGRVLAQAIDRNAIVVSENITGKYDSFRFGFSEDDQMYVGTSGASLGWGIGAAIGAKLAAPDRQVVCCIGDGSVMYSASGFWTQARYHIPVLTVVWNNRNYQTVRQAYYEYGGRMASSGKYAGMYLGNPDIDFVKLAGSQAVEGDRVGTARELSDALHRGMLANRDGKPYLIEVLIARYGGGAESTWHDSFSLAARRKRQI
jgi:thiamine pyrophosphate-dependent acetolactate synthase large subunit-like protein